MTLKDFLDKYKGVISRKEVCERIGISYSRLNLIEKGGCHRAVSKYAPLIEAMVPDCKDKIYVPPKSDTTVGWQRVEKVSFTDEEMKEIKEKPYALCFRTLKKVFDGHLFSRKVHDRIMAQVRGEIEPTINKKLIERLEKNRTNENSQSISM